MTASTFPGGYKCPLYDPGGVTRGTASTLVLTGAGLHCGCYRHCRDCCMSILVLEAPGHSGLGP